MTRRWVVILLCLGSGCSRTKEHAPPTDAVLTSTWTDLDGSHGDVHAAVLEEVRAARARHLVPVLYLTADYTIASVNLRRLRDTEPMRRALAGIAVIRVDPMSGFESLQRGYRHSFHELDEAGNPTGRFLDPGTKDGPCADGDAINCGAWIEPFTRSLVAR